MKRNTRGRKLALTSTPAWLALLIFALGFWLLATTSMIQKSATFDEPNKLISGYANLKWRDYRLVPDHPPLARRLFTRAVLYNGEADRILFWGRIPVIGLGILLGSFVFLWARQLYGTAPAIIALSLYGLDPNILAHARLATSDLSLALFIFLSLYAFYQLCKKFTLFFAFTCSLSVACAILSKHSGWLAFIMILFLGAGVVLSRVDWPLRFGVLKPLSTKKEKLYLFLVFILATLSIVYLMIWFFYGFRYRAVPDALQPNLNLVSPSLALSLVASLLNWLKEMSLFPEAYLEGILLSLSRIHLGHHFFLLGNHSTEGWWHYFLVAFLVKTPLPTLLLLGLALGFAISRKGSLENRELFLLVPVVVCFLAAILSGYNLGIRYILPIYPFLFVFISRLVPFYDGVQEKGKRLAGLLIFLWYLIASQAIYPHYLAYFNELVGGPQNGYKVLVDSNLDWGQDLKGLKKWMDKNRIDLIGLSYFGTADPRYYRIPFVYFPSIPFYYPGHEAKDVGRSPNYIAVSATNLQGVFLSEADRKVISPFLRKQPIAKIGYSIFIYQVP